MRWLTAAGCVLCVAAGATATHAFHSIGREKLALDRSTQSAAVAPALGKALQAERVTNIAMMRGVVREEIKAALMEAGAPTGPAAIDETKGGASKPALLAAQQSVHSASEKTADPTPIYVQARSLIEGAIARKSWTDADREELGAALGEMTVDERMTAIRMVIRAVNEGEMLVNVTGHRLF